MVSVRLSKSPLSSVLNEVMNLVGFVPPGLRRGANFGIRLQNDIKNGNRLAVCWVHGATRRLYCV